MMMMIGKTMITIVNGDDVSEFSLSIDAGGREADILAAGTTPLNSDPIVFTTIAIARGNHHHHHHRQGKHHHHCRHHRRHCVNFLPSAKPNHSKD